MPKLTDTQILILSRAANRPDNLALPLPEVTCIPLKSMPPERGSRMAPHVFTRRPRTHETALKGIFLPERNEVQNAT
jgi:hypothetical protein